MCHLPGAAIVNCYKNESFVIPMDDSDYEIEIKTNNNKPAVEPLASLTSEEFNRYVAVHDNVQIAADITGAELCACLQALKMSHATSKPRLMTVSQCLL